MKNVTGVSEISPIPGDIPRITGAEIEKTGTVVQTVPVVGYEISRRSERRQ